jgi:hypothetical protein
VGTHASPPVCTVYPIQVLVWYNHIRETLSSNLCLGNLVTCDPLDDYFVPSISLGLYRYISICLRAFVAAFTVLRFVSIIILGPRVAVIVVSRPGLESAQRFIMEQVENATTIPVDDEDEYVEVLTDDEYIEDDSHDGDAAGHKVTDPAPSSPTGSDAPVTHERIQWEKPDWTKNPRLSPTRRPKESVGSAIGWQKPEWAASPTKLRSTDSGKIMTTKGDLQKAITHFEKTHLDDINFEANPLLLMPTEKGYSVRLGHNLAGYVSRLDREFGHLRIVCVCLLTSV